MRLPLLANIALALLVARWKQTLIAAIGVTFSITMFIALLGFMNGLNDLLDGLVLNRTPHILLYNEIKPTAAQPITLDPALSNYYHMIRSVKPTGSQVRLRNIEAITETLENDSRVYGIAPKVTAQVYYTVGAIDLTGVINGIEVEAEDALFNFHTYVTHGTYTDLKIIPNSIILGKAAADQMLTHIGDIIQVTTLGNQQIPLKVVGFYESGILEIDKVQSYTSIATAQKLLGKPKSYITDLQLKLYDMEKAPSLSREYSSIFGVDAEDIQTANAQFETGSAVRSIISYAVGITLLIVAGFGIYNILNMMIYDKMDAIAILKATGFSGQDVRRIFVLVSLSIGVVGVLFGLLSGYLISSIIDQIPFNTPAIPTITTYPVNYDVIYYIIGAGFGIYTTYLAGYLPSRKASRVDPVEIIRGK